MEVKAKDLHFCVASTAQPQGSHTGVKYIALHAPPKNPSDYG